MNEQIVGEQLDQQIQFIALKIARGDAIDRKPVFGFLDVVFHAATLVVEAPQIDRLPFQIRDVGFVPPVAVEHQSALPVIEHLGFADDRDTTGLFPGCRFVNQGDAFDDPIFVDVTRPVATVPNFLFQPLRPFQLADVADLPAFQQAVELFAAKTLVEPDVGDVGLAEQVEGLLQKVDRVGGGMGVARSKPGVRFRRVRPSKASKG